MTGLRAAGFDFSLAASGLARTHASDGERRLSASTLATSRSPDRLRPNLMDHIRVSRILDEAIRVVKGCRPDVIAIESPLLIDLGDSSLRLAELHGAFKHWCWSRGIPYVDVHLTHVKMFATGDGGASKEDVLAAMIARYSKRCNVHIGDHNAADALSLLAMTHYAYGQPLAEVPESHRRALDSYAWPTAPGGA